MAGFILGEKQNQTRMFTEDGHMVPATVIHTSPCFVVGIKWPETDGYCAIQLGFGELKHIAKPVQGQLKKAGIKPPLRFLREIRIDLDIKGITIIEEGKKKGLKIGELELVAGSEINPAGLFQIGDIVDVSGISKGKGFQGVVGRHNFRGGPRTHGQSDRERAPGSIGSGTTPGRVFRGTRMAGRTGGARTTIQNLIVLQADDHSLTVKGLVPGHKGGLVEVRTKDIA